MIHLAYTIFQTRFEGELEYWNRLNRIRIINFNKLEGVVGGTILSTSDSGIWKDRDLEWHLKRVPYPCRYVVIKGSVHAGSGFLQYFVRCTKEEYVYMGEDGHVIFLCKDGLLRLVEVGGNWDCLVSGGNRCELVCPYVVKLFSELDGIRCYPNREWGILLRRKFWEVASRPLVAQRPNDGLFYSLQGGRIGINDLHNRYSIHNSLTAGPSGFEVWHSQQVYDTRIWDYNDIIGLKDFNNAEFCKQYKVWLRDRMQKFLSGGVRVWEVGVGRLEEVKFCISDYPKLVELFS